MTNVREQTWDILEGLLDEIEYRREEPPDFRRFRLARDDEHNYAILSIFTYNINTYKQDEKRHTRHEFLVPVATYNRDTWIRWVFDNIVAIETHETAEWFFVNDERIYAPHHGNGEDPYKQWYASYSAKKLKAPGEDND